MQNLKIEPFKLIGIAVRTTNENNKAAYDLGKLWEKFYSEDISGKIPNKESHEIYAIYTDYQTDYTGYYITTIGLKVSSLDEIPEGLIGREFIGGDYQKFVAKGKMPNAVLNTWKEIWSKDDELNRKYTADFEIYGQKSQNGENSEVEVFIAIEE